MSCANIVNLVRNNLRQKQKHAHEIHNDDHEERIQDPETIERGSDGPRAQPVIRAPSVNDVNFERNEGPHSRQDIRIRGEPNEEKLIEPLVRAHLVWDGRNPAPQRKISSAPLTSDAGPQRRQPASVERRTH